MILYCYGTRPEYLKVKKLIELSKNLEKKILYVAQHEDLIIGEYDYKITIENKKNRLDSIITSVLSDNIEAYFKDVKYVLVQGDTATAFSIALAAFHRKIKVIHLEAGLRTYNKENPYPEETYRQMISRLADVHFCPTENNIKNLEYENTEGSMFVVGNTILDLIEEKNITYEDFVLVTLHRRENHNKMYEWFTEINNLAKKHKNVKFVLPIHPNPNVIKYRGLLTDVDVVNPLPHEELLSLIRKSKLVISDSGGIQEECSFLNKKVIVCREYTERVESIGVHSFLCKNPNDLTSIFDSIYYDYLVDESCPYGDGKSSEKIIEIIKKL